MAVAFELEGDAAREPGAEALAGGAGEAHVDGVVGQAGMAVALGDLARQHGAGGAVGVADRRSEPHRRAAVERGLRFRDQLAVEDVVDLVVLRLAVEDRDALPAHRLGEQLGEVEALGLPVLDQLALVEHLHLPDHLVEACDSRSRP